MKKTVMNSEKKVLLGVYMGLSIIFFGILLIILPARAEFGKRLTQEQRHVIREEIQEAVRMAQELSTTGKYDEALRLLFDTMYKEHRNQLLVALYSDEGFPITAGDEIIRLEEYLIHEDQSPLMQWFRDPDVSLQEKQECIVELRTFAETEIEDGTEVLFREKYRGTLIQLMISQKLTSGEKFDVLHRLEYITRTEYTSSAQQEQMLKEIPYWRALAKQKLRDREYVEAFVFLSKALEKHDDTWHLGDNSDSLSLYRQISESVKEFVGVDRSPLMKLFKDRKASVAEKNKALSELHVLIRYAPTAADKVVVLGKYDGTLVQIISRPDVAGSIKTSILGYLEEMSK